MPENADIQIRKQFSGGPDHQKGIMDHPFPGIHGSEKIGSAFVGHTLPMVAVIMGNRHIAMFRQKSHERQIPLLVLSHAMINVNNGPGGAGWNNPHAGQPAVIICLYLKAVRLHWYLPITAMPWLALKKTRKFRWLFLLLLW